MQNRTKSKRLIECLEAILPPLRTIEAAESKNPMAHRETLEKLKKVVEDAKELLEKQGKKRSLSKFLSSSSVKEQFNDITQRLQAHMQALNLSVAALQRVDANTMEADDAADRQEIQAELLEMMKNNQDELRGQFADLDAGQQEKAQKMLAELTKGQDELWRDISKMTREVINNQDQLQREIMNVRDHLTGTVLNERDVILEGQQKIFRDLSDEIRKSRELDAGLSSRDNLVLHNSATGETHVAYRGTTDKISGLVAEHTADFVKKEIPKVGKALEKTGKKVGRWFKKLF